MLLFSDPGPSVCSPLRINYFVKTRDDYRCVINGPDTSRVSLCRPGSAA